MNFRDKMRVSISNADQSLWIALQNAGINFFSDKFICLKPTIPDAYIPGDPPICVYLDGPVHKKGKSVEWDVEVAEALQRRGMIVLRYDYKPPLSKTLLKKIIGDVKERMNR